MAISFFKRISCVDEWSSEIKFYPLFDIYHTWHYHQTHVVGMDGQPVLYVFASGAKRIAIPVVENAFGNYTDLTSVYGYTGPLCVDGKESSAILANEWSIISNYFSEQGVICYFSRVNDFTTHIDSLQSISGVEKSGTTVFIDLATTPIEQISNYRKVHRRDVRSLKKTGYLCDFVSYEDGIDQFIGVYHQSMDMVGASEAYYFPRQYYELLFSNPDFEVKIAIVELNGEVACAGIFFFGNGIVQYHLSGTSPAYYRHAPNKLMLDFVREYACNRGGFSVFHLGGGLGGKEDSLFKFKSGFSKNTLDFYLIKSIFNVPLYNELSKDKDANIGFFPAYRAKLKDA
jgi:hypothetical protein